jgi:hypothetical protein
LYCIGVCLKAKTKYSPSNLYYIIENATMRILKKSPVLVCFGI